MLAYKWIKILTRAWHNRELYNEERYLQCLSSNAAVQSANISANNLDLHQHFFFDRQPQR